MKKNLLLMMLCLPMLLAAQQTNGVKVSGLAVDAGTVTFNVQWTNDHAPGFLWSDTVWVFVDYNNNGVMERLPVTDASVSAGTVTKIPDNDKGVWVVGDAREHSSFSATVQLLTATANLAGVCAYASNYPPVGKYISASEISFTGTPEYKVILERNDESTYTVTVGKDESLPIPGGEAVLSFTDKTGAPGMLVPATYTLSGSDGCVGTGVTLTLSGSQLGWRYQLYKDNTAIGNVVDGTGNAIAFPDAPAAGNFNYTVWTVYNSAVTAQRAMQVSNVRAITVNALPDTPVITASAATVCQNGVLTFTVPYAANTTYTWTASAGTPSSNSYTFNTSTTGAKTATVRLTVLADGTTCQSGNAATVTAVVATMPAAATVTRVSAATVCQGTNVVFRASGTAGSTYTWLGSAGTVSGTGNGTLTVSSAATGTKSVSAYARLTSSGTTCQSNNAATVTAVVATMPAAATVTRVSAATVCQGTNVVFRASGTTGSTYTWLGTAGTVSGTGNGTLTVSSAATGAKSVSAYARLTSSGTTCQSGNAATVTAVVNPVPTISRSSGTASQSIHQNTAITAIVYTATNSATISRTGGGFPNGVTGVASSSSFTISGTPSVAGTFGYSLTAAVGGCTSTAAVGTFTVTAAPVPPPGAASTRTWVIGTQTWSASLKKAQPGCTAVADLGGDEPPAVAYYRSSDLFEGSGYLYNWKCVDDYATQLCPSPWRVPTRVDFINLDKGLGGTGLNRNTTSAFVASTYVSLWGGVYGGYADAWAINNSGSGALYWSITLDEGTPYYLFYDSYGGVYPSHHIGQRRGGFQVRCVW